MANNPKKNASQSFRKDEVEAGVTAYEEIKAINWSSLKHLAVSAKMLRHRADYPKADTKALALGRAIHCAVLEPERWQAEYVREPDFGNLQSNRAKAERAEWLAELSGGELLPRPYFDKRRKAGKEAAATFEATVAETNARVVIGDEAAGSLLGPEVTVISAADHELAERCAAEVRAHPTARDWLRGGRVEAPITWTDSETGLLCKARLDFIRPVGILDLKSTRQETLRRAAADFASRLYYGQLAWYHDGAIAAGAVARIGADLPKLLAVQTVEPFDVWPLFYDAADIQTGRLLGRDLLRQYADYLEADWWPGICPGPTQIELPPWALGGEAPAQTEGESW